MLGRHEFGVVYTAAESIRGSGSNGVANTMV